MTALALTSQPDADLELLVLDAVQRVRPDALVTYDEDGGYGHPDHRAVHRAVVAVGRDLRIPVYVRSLEPADVAVPLAPVADRVRAALANAYARAGSRLVLILPANGARSTVAGWAASHGVQTIAFQPGRDGIHPASYPSLAQRVRSVIGN